MYLALAGRRPVRLADRNVAPFRAYRFIERGLVGSFPIAILRQVKFLVLVIFDTGAVLIAPSVPFSIDATRFHKAEYRAACLGATPLTLTASIRSVVL